MDLVLGERFWSKVDKSGSGCWLWTAAVNAKGYGKYAVGNYKWKLAHRLAYEELVGPIPPGSKLLHDCDMPACVRPGPGHAQPGTTRKNNLDARDRLPHSRYVGLTRSDVRLIRTEFTGTRGQVNALAERFGVNRTTISRVIHGRSWIEE